MGSESRSRTCDSSFSDLCLILLTILEIIQTKSHKLPLIQCHLCILMDLPKKSWMGDSDRLLSRNQLAFILRVLLVTNSSQQQKEDIFKFSLENILLSFCQFPVRFNPFQALNPQFRFIYLSRLFIVGNNITRILYPAITFCIMLLSVFS